jgi:hypothetical protein
MPKSVTSTLSKELDSMSEITLMVGGLEEGDLEEDNLDAKVKLY